MSQDEITPHRPERPDELPPSELEPPAQREVPPKSGFPWLPVAIGCGALGLLGCVGSVAFLLLFPAVTKVRETAAHAQRSNDMRQIGLAIHNCNDLFMEVPQVSGRWKEPPGDLTERSLFVHLLPYVEQDVLYKNILKGSASPNQLVKTFVNPADFTGNGTGGECSYAANWQLFQTPPGGPEGLPSFASIPRSMPDGTTNVIMVAEIYQICGGTTRRWGQTGPAGFYTTPAFNRTENPAVLTPLPLFQVAPRQHDCVAPLAQTPHAGGMIVCLGDASVRSLAKNMSLTTWQRACSPGDGNILGMNPNTNDW